MTTPQDPKKNDNNNNLGNSHNKNKLVTTFQEQKTLFGGPVLKKEFKLNKNYFRLLELFAINPEVRWTRNKIFNSIQEQMHQNTISNFISQAIKKEFIKECRIIPKSKINTIYLYQEIPERFEDGTRVPDNRAAYYQVTQIGIEVYKLNEKYNANLKKD